MKKSAKYYIKKQKRTNKRTNKRTIGGDYGKIANHGLQNLAKIPGNVLGIANSALNVGNQSIKTVGDTFGVARSGLGLGKTALDSTGQLIGKSTNFLGSTFDSSGQLIGKSTNFLGTTLDSSGKLSTASMGAVSEAINNTVPLTKGSLQAATSGMEMLNQVISRTATPLSSTIGDTMSLVHSSISMAGEFMGGLIALLTYPAKAVVRSLSERNSRKTIEMEQRMKEIERNSTLSDWEKQTQIAKSQLEYINLQKQLQLAMLIEKEQTETKEKLEQNPELEAKVATVIQNAQQNGGKKSKKNRKYKRTNKRNRKTKRYF